MQEFVYRNLIYKAQTKKPFVPIFFEKYLR